MPTMALVDDVQFVGELIATVEGYVVLKVAQLLVVRAPQLASLEKRPPLPPPCVRAFHGAIMDP